MRSPAAWLLVAVLSFPPLAGAYTVDFEGLAAVTIVDDEYATSPLGLTVSAENFHNDVDAAVVFDTNAPTGGDTDLGAPFSNPALGQSVPGNILILQEQGPCNLLSCDVPDDEGRRPAGTIVLDFATAVFLESLDFFDIESAEAGGAIRLFDADAAEIAPNTFFTPDTGGDNTWERLTFKVGHVRKIEIDMMGSGGVDRLDAQVVPLPPAALLFSSALAALGFVRHRRDQ